MLLNNKEVYDFFKSIEFEKLLICVGKEDVQSFKNNNQWLAIHPKEAIVFLSPDIVWNEIRSTYRTTFRDFVIGDLPNETSMLSTLKKVSERLGSIRWEVNN